MKELGPDARELIRRVGGADGPAHATRDRIKRSLVAAIAAGATTAGTTGAAAAIGAVAASKTAATAGMAQIGVWFVAGGLIGAAVVAPVALTSSAPAPSSRASSVSVEGRAPQRVAETTAAPAEPLPAAPEPLPEPATSSTIPSQKTPSAAPAPSALGQEVQLLKDAQRELSTGNAARALALLDAHRAQFPRGELRGERMAARVFALCALGRVEEARRDAELFLAFAPDSPLVPRLMGSCALRNADESNGASR